MTERESSPPTARSGFTRRPWMRWSVPAGVVVVIGAAALAANAPASADSGLAPRTAAQLLVDVAGAKVPGVSGTVVMSADLGLPTLPKISGAPSAASTGGPDLTSALALLSGDHTFRVWAGSAGKSRVALLDGATETDWISNGTDAWLWSSADASVLHASAPTGTMMHPGAAGKGTTPNSTTRPTPKSMPSTMPTSMPTSPAAAASAVLAAIDPSTEVTTSGAGKVAGRTTYELTLAPRDTASLVRSVRLSIDSATSMPLGVSVFAAGQSTPAFSIAFTSVSVAAQPDSIFSFTPPAGATVTEAKDLVAAAAAKQPADTPTTTPKSSGTAGRAKVVGSGWTTVAIAPMPSGAALGDGPAGPAVGSTSPTAKAPASSGDQLGALLASMPRVSGTWGSGRLIRTALVTVVITDDGRVAVGAVTPERIYAALAAS